LPLNCPGLQESVNCGVVKCISRFGADRLIRAELQHCCQQRKSPVTHTPIEEYLSSQEFFSGLSQESIGFLASCASEQVIESGEVLFRQSDRAHHFYLIRNGTISIEVPAITGPTLKVQSLGAGQILGWSWLIPPYKWNFQARAEEQTSLFAFDGDAVLARCEEEPQFGYALLKRFASLMAERLEVARRKMMDQWNPPGFA
jgi:CRP/FNR family cyclic AMP-dependent transcriptional regulator